MGGLFCLGFLLSVALRCLFGLFVSYSHGTESFGMKTGMQNAFTCWRKPRHSWKTALVALCCLVSYEQRFSLSFPNPSVHRVLKIPFCSKAEQKAVTGGGSAPQVCPHKIFKLDRLDTNNMVIASSSKADSGIAKAAVLGPTDFWIRLLGQWKGPEPALIFSNWEQRRLQLLRPLGCVAMKMQDPDPPVSPAFGLRHTHDVVQCPFICTASPAAAILGWVWQQVGRTLVSKGREKSGEIGSQGGCRTHGYLLVGWRTEPSLGFPPIFWAAMNFAQCTFSLICVNWLFCSVFAFITSKKVEMEKVLQRSARLCSSSHYHYSPPQPPATLFNDNYCAPEIAEA